MVLQESINLYNFSFRYGDECFYGKISLLHFIVFFLLGGMTVAIVGAVQFKEEAGLANLRYDSYLAMSYAHN